MLVLAAADWLVAIGWVATPVVTFALAIRVQTRLLREQRLDELRDVLDEHIRNMHTLLLAADRLHKATGAILTPPNWSVASDEAKKDREEALADGWAVHDVLRAAQSRLRLRVGRRDRSKLLPAVQEADAALAVYWHTVGNRDSVDWVFASHRRAQCVAALHAFTDAGFERVGIPPPTEPSPLWERLPLPPDDRA